MKIYLAGPLFTQAEISFNKNIANNLIEAGFEVFLPQEECLGNSVEEIRNICIKGINVSDVVLANMDGSDADSGTCFECGYAYGIRKPIIGFRTDFRSGGDIDGYNAMLYYSFNHVIDGSEDGYVDNIIKCLNEIKLLIKK